MSRFKSVAIGIGSFALLVAAAGCTTSGLSPRETRGQDFSTYSMALYDMPAPDPAVARLPVRPPLNVAVAQVGEVAPPDVVIDTLQAETALFASVQPVPALIDASGQVSYRGDSADYQVQARRAAQAHVQRLRRMASDLGADYLFLFGGTIDRATTSTPLSAADLTIIGGFFVPSKRIHGTARAAGALVDVQTGHVVLSVSADQESTRLAPSFSQDNGELKLLTNLRDDVVAELAQELTERMKSRAGAGG